MFLTAVAFFFIHNIVLAPILLEEGNARKYLWFTISCLIVFTVLELRVFSALDGIDLHHLFRTEYFIDAFAILSILLIVIIILSFFYTLIIYGINKILPYWEFLVHIIILLTFFSFAVFAGGMQAKAIFGICMVVSVFYTNAFMVTPKLIKNQKKLKYAFELIALCIGYYILRILLLEAFGYPKFDPETGDSLSRESIPQTIFSILSVFALITTLFLSFIYSYVRLKIISKEKLFNLKLGAKESELNLLKSQVNPHFLFNTLNTLYATALTENSVKTSESIAKLASLIRYMQEDMIKDFIPLQNEIKYLQDYIAIQKLRCAVEPQLETNFKNIEDHRISPGLLIPFVENAFKYGIDPSKPSKLSVSVICDQRTMYFECVNSYGYAFKTYYKEQGFGIGIKNAKQRLELVYPNNHTFEVEKENNIFSVKISIITKTS